MDFNYVEEVRTWIERFVIGFNLCPFAKQPFDADKIKYLVADLEGDVSLLSVFEKELKSLEENNYATTVIIIPTKDLSFRNYLDLFELCEASLLKLELEDRFQLASFHPDYQFADSKSTDQSNYTNRSPYPLIHILRADELEKAIQSYGDTSKIYKRNIELLNKMSKEELDTYYA